MRKQMFEKRQDRRVSDKILLTLSLFICFYFVFRDFGIRMMFGYLALMGCIMFFFLEWLRKKEFSVIDEQIYILVLAAFILVSFLRADSRHDADIVSYMIAMSVFSVLVFLSNPGRSEVRISLRIFMVAACFFSIYVIGLVIKPGLFWKYLYPHLSVTAKEYLDYYVPRGYSITIGGVTYTNYILFMGIACSLGALFGNSRDQIIKRLVYVGIMGISLIAILVTGRRGELLGSVITIAIVFVISGNLVQRLHRVPLLIAIVMGGSILLFTLLPLLKKIEFLYRYVMTIEKFMAGSDVTSGRQELYTLALAKFAEKPLFGNGWGSFANFIPDAFREIHGNVDDVHNIYLQFLCETGIIGAFVIILMLGKIYYRTTKNYLLLLRNKNVDSKMNIVRSAAGCAFSIQTFLLIMGIFDPCFERLVFWCFYGISVILASAAQKIFNKEVNGELIC